MRVFVAWMATLVISVSATGCQRSSETVHEEEGIAVTAWGEHYEIFAEADPLVVGEVSKSHTHVTVLDSFPPLKQGVVTAMLHDPSGAEQAFPQERALRDGIFSVEIKPARTGVFDFSFRVESQAGVEQIPAGRVQVGTGDSAGLLVAPPKYGPPNAPAVTPPSGEPISFLKEQQWRIAFGTEWARLGTVARGARGPARIRPAAGGEVLLTAPLDGTVSVATRAHVGMDVARGSTVVRLHSRAGSDRSVEAIRAELELARARLDRLEELFKVEAVSQAELDETRARVRTLSAEQRAISGGGSELSVRSPFAGRVAEVLVVPGQAVSSGTPLARVVRTKPLWVEVGLSPSDIGALAQGITGLVIYPSGGRPPISFQQAEVRLISRSPEIERATGSVTATLEVRTDHPLRPGATVDAEVLLPGGAQGVILPATAVVDDGGVPVVYIQVEGETFVRQEVRILTTQGDRVVVEGVPVGVRVVTVGGAAIRRAALLRTGPPEGHVH